MHGYGIALNSGFLTSGSLRLLQSALAAETDIIADSVQNLTAQWRIEISAFSSRLVSTQMG